MMRVADQGVIFRVRVMDAGGIADLTAQVYNMKEFVSYYASYT